MTKHRWKELTFVRWVINQSWNGWNPALCCTARDEELSVLAITAKLSSSSDWMKVILFESGLAFASCLILILPFFSSGGFPLYFHFYILQQVTHPSYSLHEYCMTWQWPAPILIDFGGLFLFFFFFSLLIHWSSLLLLSLKYRLKKKKTFMPCVSFCFFMVKSYIKENLNVRVQQQNFKALTVRHYYFKSALTFWDLIKHYSTDWHIYNTYTSDQLNCLILSTVQCLVISFIISFPQNML